MIGTGPRGVAACRALSERGIPFDCFEKLGCLDRLAAFVSEHGRRFYGLSGAAGEVTLEREPQTVPEAYGDVVPFLSGKEIAYRLARST